jgi:hypothetical protein
MYVGKELLTCEKDLNHVRNSIALTCKFDKATICSPSSYPVVIVWIESDYQPHKGGRVAYGRYVYPEEF